MIEHGRLGGERPVRISVGGRDLCDPHNVALEISGRDLGERARTELVEQRFTALARAIYPSRREYWSAIEDALHEPRYPDESTRRPRAVPIFDPRTTISARSWPKLSRPAASYWGWPIPSTSRASRSIGLAG